MKLSAAPSSAAFRSDKINMMHTEGLTSGTLLRIERASIHDGPGLRTVLFLKGCPLRCAWCSTPESQEYLVERGYLRTLCTACGKCVEACPARALSISADGFAVIGNEAKCRKCFTCARSCPRRAIKRYGYTISVEEAVREIMKDELFYFHSRGGVTISGGEPLCQPHFTAAVLQVCTGLGIHTAVETSLHVNLERVGIVLPWLDVLYVDIKHMNSRQHARWTGDGNALILDNIRKIDQSAYSLEIVVRIPLIPHINDTARNLRSTLEFCQSLNKIKEIELLPYHRLGINTYDHLSKNFPCRSLAPHTADQVAEKVAYMKGLHSGIPVKSGIGFNSD